MKLTCRVNAKTEVLDVEPLTPLIEVLRERLALIGAHQGCTGDNCGACTVLVNDVPVYSCQVPVCQVEGAEVRTVEGLTSDPERLAPLQAALAKAGATACGFCTPGMLMTGLALRQRQPRPGPEELRSLLSGNLCRCTGYEAIVQAMLQVIQ
ncbi:MAG: carbon-monoxide dehydrogenase small subunit [Cognaticolwellia sp.]|jgi:carbon-monoxide dehydrogenase small subunit